LFTAAGFLKSEEKKPPSGFPGILIITLSHPCGEKLLLLHHSALGVPKSGILKNRVATIKNMFWRRYRGSSKRFFTFVRVSFTLDFAIVFLFSSCILLLKNQK
jgi:hypothetical protein